MPQDLGRGRPPGRHEAVAGSILARPACQPTMPSKTITTSITSTGTVQVPVTACTKPTASGPAVATRDAPPWVNADSEADVTRPGARAALKQIATPQAPPRPTPNSRGQT